MFYTVHKLADIFLFFFLAFLRYIMVSKIFDASGEAWISAFNEEAEKIVGCSADELDKLLIRGKALFC